MKFRSLPVSQAKGKILGHNIAGADGRRVLRKGKPLDENDLRTLQAAGRETVYVAELEADDVDENTAAHRIATAAQGAHLTVSKPTTGRANLHSEVLGLLRIDETQLLQVNLCEAVTLATLSNHVVVYPGQMVATLKVIAYGLPENVVREAEFLSSQAVGRPLLNIDPLPERAVGMILSGSPTTQERIIDGFTKAMRPRLENWGARLVRTEFVPLEDESGERELAQLLLNFIENGIEMIILAGETAIMDRHDIAPRAIERAGGRITAFGAPVDPGNLLLIARHDASGRTVHIVGTPGCARSPKKNIVDLIIPRLLAGDYLTKMDIVRLGHGGMLDDVTERGRPRKYS